MKKISRREFTRVRGALALGALASCNKADMVLKKDRPNVIFFMTDDQRWDGMSCAGNPYFRTPNMDRIAREGIPRLSGEDAVENTLSLPISAPRVRRKAWQT